MAALTILRSIPLRRLRFDHHHLAVGILTPVTRKWCATAESVNDASSSEKKTAASLNARPPIRYWGWDDEDYRKWKDKEEEILKDIGPVISRTKNILHSNRYKDGSLLTAEDEKIVVEHLLAYHPNSEDKIGCGIDSIMVDRHPQYRNSRCLFVVRTDGGWIDFSYQKCIRSYLRAKYPSYGERFIREHFKRGSS